MRTFESKDRCCDRVDIYYIYEAQSLDNRRVFWFVRRIMAAYSDSVLDNILLCIKIQTILSETSDLAVQNSTLI